jgi:hypothetical protein
VRQAYRILSFGLPHRDPAPADVRQTYCAPASTCRTAQNQRNGHDVGATNQQIMALRDHIAAQQVTCVALGDTNDYWKPFYYLPDDLLGTVAMSISHTHGIYLAAKYRRVGMHDISDRGQRVPVCKSANA